MVLQLLFIIFIGIKVKLSQRTLNIKVVLLSGVYDIPAKNLVCGFVGHNGQYACTRCVHPGKVLVTNRGVHILSK